MTRVSVKSAENKFSELIERAADNKERVAFTRNGKTVAVMLSAEDFELLRRLEKEEIEDVRDARKELAAWKRDGGKQLQRDHVQ